MAREAKKDFQGPFLGFTYNGRHSSELGIVRINTGNRAEMPLSPSFKDSTAEVPGGKGLYYFNTQIQQRQFTINFAYDDLTEEDVRELREWLNPLEQGELIFDEEPYKAYTVKPNTQPKLSYLVFDREITTETFKLYEPSTVKSSGRVYKGEGAIGLTAYYPYAKAPYKTIEDYSVYKDIEKKEFSHYRGYGHPDEWAIASGMDKKPSLVSPQCYNCGDIETPVTLNFKVAKNINTNEAVSGNVGIELYSGTTSQIGTRIGYVYMDASKMSVNVLYTINSKLELITDENGVARNDIIVASKFFYLPPREECFFSVNYLSGYTGERTNSTTAITNIDYDYLYL